MYEVDENTTFIEEKSGGETHKFYILTVYDRMALLKNVRHRARDIFCEALARVGLEREEKLTELVAWEERWNDEDEFVKFVNSAAADTEVFERALRIEDKEKVRAVVEGLKLSASQRLAFKASLCNLQLVTPAPETPPGEVMGGAADPSRPGTTYGT